MPSFDGGDDFVGVLGPGEGFGVGIDVVEKAVDGIFELLKGSEYAPFEPPLSKGGKQAFNSVQPGGRRRGKVEHEARMFGDPFHNLGMLVGSVVVEDDMDRLPLGHPGVDDV